MSRASHSKVRKALLSLFDRKFIEDLAVDSGFLQRRCKVLPFELTILIYVALDYSFEPLDLILKFSLFQ